MIQRRSLATISAAIRRQRILFASILIIGGLLAVFALLRIHTKYTATATLLMVAEPAGQSEQNPVNPSKPLISNDLPSLAVSETVLTRLRADLGETAPIESIAANVHAKVSFDSTIMPVQYTSRDPDVAVRGANALSDEISRYYREIVTSRFDSLINDLTRQLNASRAQLADLDSQLDSSARAYPYIDVQSQTTPGGTQGSIYQRLIELSSERDTLLAQVKGDQATSSATTRLMDNARPIAERDLLDSDTEYRNIHDQYARDLEQLQHIGAYGNNQYPGLAELRDTVSREAADVEKARQHAVSANPSRSAAYAAALDSQVHADATLSSDQAKLASIDQSLGELHSQIGSGNIANNVARIRRDRDSNEAAYSMIAKRLSEAIADRAQAGSTGSVIVIDRSAYAKPATFSSGRFIAIALIVLTLWFSVTAAVLVDADRQAIVRSPDMPANLREELAFSREA